MESPGSSRDATHDAGPAWPILFDRAARRFGGAVAVTDDAVSWSYRELAARANRLARWLGSRGIGQGDVVAIHAHRRAAVAWAMLGVLKSGAALTLVDAGYPAARRIAQLDVAMPAAWIETGPVDETVDEAVPGATGNPRLDARIRLISHRIHLDEAAALLSALPDESPAIAIAASSPAYLIFTSGTTARPKAVAIAHAGLAHFVAWQSVGFDLGPDDRFAGLSGLAHAPFIRDVVAPLAVGASLHLPDPHLRRDADRLAGWLRQQRISVWHLTPALGSLLLQAQARSSLPTLRWVFFSGEPLTGSLARSLSELAPQAGIVNFYAASETPQAVAWHRLAAPVAGPVPVGQAIDGFELRVVDREGEPAPAGQTGEIWVRSRYLPTAYVDGLAGGFGVDPTTRDPLDRIWRSGDLGRVRGDGAIEIVGRIDDQIKVRGYRIEPAAIEDLIRTLGLADAAAVAAGRDGSLIAFVTPGADPERLRAALAGELPAYMVPTAVVTLDALPLTPNGKLDRRALADRRPSRPPQRTGDHPSAAATRGAAVQGVANPSALERIEAAIAAIWQEVLECGPVARTDNFFDLGGHSLNATRIVTRLREATGADLALRLVFEAPTVAELARHVAPLVAASARRDGPRPDHPTRR